MGLSDPMLVNQNHNEAKALMNVLSDCLDSMPQHNTWTCGRAEDLKIFQNLSPTAEKGVIPKYPFGTFQIDRGLLERIEHTEDEVGAINETFKRIFGWKTRTTGDGILEIKERGDSASVGDQDVDWDQIWIIHTAFCY